MVGVLMRISGMFDSWFGHRNLIKKVKIMEKERQEYDNRIENLTRATLDGDEEWFLKVVKKDPSCALKVIEGCHIKTNV